VTETDNAYEIAAELPGMNEKDIEVKFADGVLTIKGENKIGGLPAFGGRASAADIGG
jgi:HSP20 family molecular chaperone IbpA